MEKETSQGAKDVTFQYDEVLQIQGKLLLAGYSD